MEDKIKIGDVVQLKSGGTRMTISTVHGSASCWCYYLDNNGELHNVWMPQSALRQADEATSGEPTVDLDTVKASQETSPRKPREWIVVSVNNEIYSKFDGSFREGQWFRVREVLE